MTGDAPATSVRLSNPRSIAFTSSGELLVPDNNKVIRKMDPSGFMKVIAGGGSESPSFNHPISAKATYIEPTIIAYARDGSDAIFIGDERHHSGCFFDTTRSNIVAVPSTHLCRAMWMVSSSFELLWMSDIQKSTGICVVHFHKFFHSLLEPIASTTFGSIFLPLLVRSSATFSPHTMGMCPRMITSGRMNER